MVYYFMHSVKVVYINIAKVGKIFNFPNFICNFFVVVSNGESLGGFLCLLNSTLQR